MTVFKSIRTYAIAMFFPILLASAAFAQDTGAKERERVARADAAASATPPLVSDASPAPGETPKPGDDSKDVEEIVGYYANYLEEYRLGPEDVISVQVFGQCPDYCKEELTIPPTARISYPLIRDGIFVAGKTTFEVEKEITKALNEYIIDPKVTVTLMKVGSARYGVVGKVETPGMKLMTRKISIFEAITDAGGITKEGDKKQAVILRPNRENRFDPIVVNLKDIQAGKAEMVFLQPGDQVVVGKEGFNLGTVLDALTKASFLRILLPF